ncbi:MAG: CocE/NonD family hydrolase [Planctomycetaceae bacterium]|nr:CocE/NonD family hydrolase [Planctomycetaceae bacterium]
MLRFEANLLRACAIACLAACMSAGDCLHAADAVHAVATQGNVMVPMRDGVRLATDVYLPARNGKPLDERLPTILMRTPYGKSGLKEGAPANADGRYFAERGYAVVIQDTRGRYQSEGVWHMLTDDGRDGFDTCAWIGQQPWSNGKVGTIGTSYVGGTQHALALERPPELVTAIPVDAMSNLGFAGMRNGGAFELRFWNWIYSIAGPHGSRQARDPATAAMLLEMQESRRDYLLRLPLRRGTTPLKFLPEYEEWLVDAMGHGLNDEFWRQNNIIDQASQYKDIPLYLVGGWYDSWAGCTSANYKALAKKLKSPIYLIMGPWIHGQQGGSAHGQVSFGPAAAIPDPRAWRLEWYDHWLRGIENSVGRREPFASRVRIFVMGTGDGSKDQKSGHLNHGGYWRDEQEWPLTRATATPYYLHPSGQLQTAVPASDAGATSFTFDPRNPVPTIGGNISSGDGILLQGAWDQRGGPHVWNMPEPIPLAARNDVLVFQTEPLSADVEVTGDIVVRLWITSSASDTDFTAKLIDVYPPSADFPRGFDLNIGDGIRRARFRESLSHRAFMEPGQTYPLEIQLYPTSNVFKAGHRIRVDISSSNFPRFDVNPNTGEHLNRNRRVQTAINTVLHDADHPSHILLPIVPIEPARIPAPASGR